MPKIDSVDKIPVTASKLNIFLAAFHCFQQTLQIAVIISLIKSYKIIPAVCKYGEKHQKIIINIVNKIL